MTRLKLKDCGAAAKTRQSKMIERKTAIVAGSNADLARLETGPMTLANDWPGIFIRGDDALAYSAALRALLDRAETRGARSEDEAGCLARVTELARLLETCRVRG